MSNGLQMKYFVLKPKGMDIYAKASRAAMVAYADTIAEKNPDLSEDLFDWVERTEAESKIKKDKA